MNTYTGEIAALSVLAGELEKQGKSRSEIETVIKPIDPANLTARARAQLEATGRTQISRNSPCPCGSRKRFKRCCQRRTDEGTEKQ